MNAGKILSEKGMTVTELTPEQIDAFRKLAQLPGVVLSDHTAWYSAESVIELQRKAAEEVARILSGQQPRHWVNAWSDDDTPAAPAQHQTRR